MQWAAVRPGPPFRFVLSSLPFSISTTALPLDRPGSSPTAESVVTTGLSRSRFLSSHTARETKSNRERELGPTTKHCF
ncbi:hypothetical protein GQ53DRAFT_742869 [Thozetella sp. PMI_491]|nr:hypothetical protein GQ53DRAFT_742869 [Thozetella sp. PMI_491]